MNFYHFVTSTFYPSNGGMEESVKRISSFLTDKSNISQIYVRKGTKVADSNAVYISDLVCEDIAGLNDSENLVDEYQRLEFLHLNNQIKINIDKNSEHRHFIISFFCSSSGFICQKIALTLDIPHIASVRGSDISVYVHNRSFFSVLNYLFLKANYVITTNNEQIKIIGNYFNRYDNISTIHNSLVDVTNIPFYNTGSFDNYILFTDVGLSFKKGIKTLLDSFLEVLNSNPRATLRIAGENNSQYGNYIKQVINKLSIDIQSKIILLGYLKKEEIISEILNCSIYLHPSLNEGCSNARLLAYAIGVPVITSNCGEVLDLKELIQNVYTYNQLEKKELVNLINNLFYLSFQNQITINKERLLNLREYLDCKREQAQWEKIISLFTKKKDTVYKNTQKRILFYVHDGTGLGHLRRVSRIAEALQGPYSCLILSGHRYQANIISDKCEFVHIPSLDSLVERNSRYWGRKPFLEISPSEIKIFRTKLINSVVDTFDPDAIFVDFLPLGKNEELMYPIMNHRAKKYFVIRGVLDDPSNVRIDVLGGMGEYALEKYYHKIIVACDKKIIDVAKEYMFSKSISEKMVYAGYVAPLISTYERGITRLERGLKDNDIWVVCSAGGGMLGERLIEECVRMSKNYQQIKFDIILGPKSNLKWNRLSVNQFEENNVRFFKENDKLEIMHSAADIVINPGGYNSLVETITGNGILITVPVQLRTNDEQFIHSDRLSSLIPQIIALKNIKDLPETFKQVIESLDDLKMATRKHVSIEGVVSIKELLNYDLFN